MGGNIDTIHSQKSFLKLSFTPCMAEQPLQDMELQEEEKDKKDIWKNLEWAQRRKVSINSRLKPLKSQFKGEHSAGKVLQSPSILKDDFSSSRDPSIFTSIAPELLNWLNKTSRVFLSLKSASTEFKFKSHTSDVW